MRGAVQTQNSSKFYGTLRGKKQDESMFNSFSFVVGLMGDGGEDLQGARCFLKRRITSFFT